MVDIPADILASLVCSKCEQLLKRGPVYQQHDGAAVCGLCQAGKEAQPASRCLLYEATAQLLRFPCRYQEEGCPTTVPFLAAGSTELPHEDACEYRHYVCPVLGSNRCDWSGRRNQLLQHCQEEHPDRVLPNPALITPDIRYSQMTDYIISAFQFLFLLHTRVCVSTAKLHYAVRLLGDPQLASNYSFTVTLRRGENVIIQSREVLPQDLLALQEHSALNLSTNSVLGMLGGWDGASLTVEVKARRSQAEHEQEQAEPEQEHAEDERNRCDICAEFTPRVFRQGWLCAGCIPQKEMCDNEGCDFQDIGWKREKHSWYFCQRRTSCFVCSEDLQPGTQLQQHYTTCREIRVIPAGSRFLVRRNNDWHWFLMETAAGQVLCYCNYYSQHNFTLEVHALMPCEQLHLHRCEVRLECAGNTRTHIPDTNYDTPWDWVFDCKNDKFFSNPEVHVHIQVCKNY